MTFEETMKTLESMGTAQNRKIYARHGYPENMFGVSFANLGALKKKIKTDQALAHLLWKSGNGDAQALALMVADPAKMTLAEIETWMTRTNSHCLADLFARQLVARTPHARKLMEKWTKSKDDPVGVAGYDLLGMLALYDSELPDEFFLPWIAKIEEKIHKAANRTRYAMNGALIGIGMRSPKLEKLAIAAAGRIGKVHVDHGETGCKTPDAASYILKAKARKKK
jgi:3-methyladenine DNA glycosylase AlkD